MIKRNLIRYLKDNVTQAKSRELLEILDETKLCGLIFFDRNIENSGARLSPRGFKLVSECMAIYEVLVEDGYSLTSKDILWMHRNLKTPYYISVKRVRDNTPSGAIITSSTTLYLTDEIEAAMLTLAGGRFPH